MASSLCKFRKPSSLLLKCYRGNGRLRQGVEELAGAALGISVVVFPAGCCIGFEDGGTLRLTGQLIV
jgi:hypothetical protein